MLVGTGTGAGEGEKEEHTLLDDRNVLLSGNHLDGKKIQVSRKKQSLGRTENCGSFSP